MHHGVKSQFLLFVLVSSCFSAWHKRGVIYSVRICKVNELQPIDSVSSSSVLHGCATCLICSKQHFLGSDHCFFSPEFICISVYSVLLMYSHIEYVFLSCFLTLRVLHKEFLLYLACAVKCASSSNKCPGRIIIYIRKKCHVFRDGCFNMGYWPAISFGPWIDGSANSPFLFSV